ncbi:NAD(P)H-dependent oxidoreductase subunit E, partial [Streptomyces nodosus]
SAATATASAAEVKPITGQEPGLTSAAWNEVPGHRHQVLVCRGPRCTAKGSDETLAALVRRLTEHGLGDDDVLVTQTGCQFPCNQAPVVSVQPDDVWYGRVDAAAAVTILSEHVRVSLQLSPYGGTTAVVFIPDTLLSDDVPDTNGIGFRLDRPLPEKKAGTEDERRAALAHVPAKLPGPPASLLNGPVELEAPVDPDALGGHPDAPIPLPRRRRTPKLVSSHGRPVTGPGPRRAPQDEEPPRTVSPDGPDGTTPAPRETAAGPAEPGASALPRRVRQVGPAPQRKESSDRRAEHEPSRSENGAGLDDRDADEVRRRFTSLQRGWRRGREENAEGDDARDGSAPGTTEGDGR